MKDDERYPAVLLALRVALCLAVVLGLVVTLCLAVPVALGLVVLLAALLDRGPRRLSANRAAVSEEWAAARFLGRLARDDAYNPGRRCEGGSARLRAGRFRSLRPCAAVARLQGRSRDARHLARGVRGAGKRADVAPSRQEDERRECDQRERSPGGHEQADRGYDYPRRTTSHTSPFGTRLPRVEF
jgi:hypothetical protein